jgi:uncharacterized membrane protein YesL
MNDLNEATYVTTSARQFWDGLGVLLMATLAALALASPWLLTIVLGTEPFALPLCALVGAPAWAGLVSVTTAWVQAQPIGRFAVFRAAWRLFPRAVPLGAATAGFGWWFGQALSGIERGGMLHLAAIGVASLLFAATLAVDLHGFPLLALHDLPLLPTVRAALFLAVAAPGATLGLLSAWTLSLFALAWLGPGWLLISLPVLAVYTVNNTRLQVRRFGA